MHISNEKFMSKLVDLEEPAKLTSVGFQHSFAVTEQNKIFSWLNDSTGEAEIKHFEV
jgi:hypothetical protein